MIAIAAGAMARPDLGNRVIVSVVETPLCNLWSICAAMDAHPGQAAWFQAVFSVIAILASAGVAIWVDRGASRRLEARELASARQARDARRRAVVNIRDVFYNSAKHFDAMTFETPSTKEIGPGPRRAFRTAQAVLDHYIARGSDVDALMVATMSHVRDFSADAWAPIEVTTVRDVESRDRVAKRLRLAGDQINQALSEYDQGIW